MKEEDKVKNDILVRRVPKEKNKGEKEEIERFE